MIDTIAVTTDDPCDHILRAGNSAAWSLNFRRWHNQLRYLLCMRNIDGQRRAFLLCMISNIVVDRDASVGGRTKYAVEFSRYLFVDEEVKLSGSQNPVRLCQLSHVLPGFLVPPVERFNETGEKDLDYSYSEKAPRSKGAGLSVEEAKRGLALRFGVPETAITISIAC